MNSYRPLLTTLLCMFTGGSVLSLANVLQLRAIEWQSDGIARNRYANGCIQLDRPIRSGIPVSDKNGNPLSDGTPVCDNLGSSGVMLNGVITDVAAISDWSAYTEEKLRRNPNVDPEKEYRLRDPDGSYYRKDAENPRVSTGE